MVLDYFDFLVDFTTFKAGGRILITVLKKKPDVSFFGEDAGQQTGIHPHNRVINSGEF